VLTRVSDLLSGHFSFPNPVKFLSECGPGGGLSNYPLGIVIWKFALDRE
jgi:hypothetical protein